MTIDASPTFQERAKNIPNPVATAFPPLPLSHIGQICPAIADMPAITSITVSYTHLTLPTITEV